MKKLLLFFIIFPLMVACKNGNKKPTENNPVQLEENNDVSDTTSGTVEGELLDEAATEKDGVQTEVTEEETDLENSTQTAELEGRYRLTENNSTTNACVCNCVEISFTSATELCIVPNEVYISGRFVKTGTNKANVFFEEVVRYEASENEIPWEDFDKNTPVATVSMRPDGSMELDWLGFAINGEIAVDYAIYGKKTLEGTYKKD